MNETHPEKEPVFLFYRQPDRSKTCSRTSIDTWKDNAAAWALSVEQWESMLASCSSAGPVAMLDRAMLLLCARLGLRPSEVLRLVLQDLHGTTGCVLIRADKTSRERVLPLPEDAGAALASYLHQARPVSTERAGYSGT